MKLSAKMQGAYDVAQTGVKFVTLDAAQFVRLVDYMQARDKALDEPRRLKCILYRAENRLSRAENLLIDLRRILRQERTGEK